MMAGSIQRRVYGLRHYLVLAWRGVRISPLTYVSIDKTATLAIGKGCRIKSRYLSVGPNANLKIGASAEITGNISVGEGCSVSIGDHFQLLKANLIVTQESKVQMGNHCLLASEPSYGAGIRAIGGQIAFGDNVNLRATVTVDGGRLSIRSNTFINQGSELRCEEKIDIGQYVYVSYLVDIFDTNTHPTDWRARQREVDVGFPNRALRQERQSTAPIELGDHVWIGKMAAILKGVRIGPRSVVGTRAVVTSSCPEDSLLAGNPATVRALRIKQESHESDS